MLEIYEPIYHCDLENYKRYDKWENNIKNNMKKMRDK